MAPQWLEKIESAPRNGRVWEASNLQDIVHSRTADRVRLRLTSCENDKVAKGQKQAPNTLKTLDAELKSVPAFPHRGARAITSACCAWFARPLRRRSEASTSIRRRAGTPI